MSRKIWVYPETVRLKDSNRKSGEISGVLKGENSNITVSVLLFLPSIKCFAIILSVSFESDSKVASRLAGQGRKSEVVTSVLWYRAFTVPLTSSCSGRTAGCPFCSLWWGNREARVQVVKVWQLHPGLLRPLVCKFISYWRCHKLPQT